MRLIPRVGKFFGSGESPMTFQRSFLVRGGLFAALVAMLFAGATFAAGATEYVVYNFPHTTLPILAGCNPVGNLLADSEGNLYGAAGCGTFSQGVIFKLTRPVAPVTAWTESVLYAFTGGSDGASPNGGLIWDSAGNLYGTTGAGGTSGKGTVFELSPPAAGLTDWTETVLYSFEGGTTDGENPLAGVVFDKSGNLYGVTFQGGTVDKALCRIPGRLALGGGMREVAEAARMATPPPGPARARSAAGWHLPCNLRGLPGGGAGTPPGGERLPRDGCLQGRGAALALAGLPRRADYVGLRQL